MSFMKLWQERKIKSDPTPVLLKSTTESETSDFIPARCGNHIGSEIESENTWENEATSNERTSTLINAKHEIPEIQYPAVTMTVRRTFLEPQDEPMCSLLEFLHKRETKSCPGSRIQLASAAESDASEFIPQCPELSGPNRLICFFVKSSLLLF